MNMPPRGWNTLPEEVSHLDELGKLIISDSPSSQAVKILYDILLDETERRN